MHTDDTRRAYADFIDAAQRGHFQRPTQPGWDAEMVLAHVIVGDRLIAEAAAKVITGAPVHFDNLASQSEPYLRAVVAAAGDWQGLVATLKRGGEELAGVIDSLTPEQLATPIPCRIVSDNAVVIDAPFPLQHLAALTGGTEARQVAPASSA